MLARLGRWLRAAGYNTVIIDQPLSDREIAQRAREEQRIVITRDRHFLEFQEISDLVIWLKANSVEECARELSERLPLNWTLAPFSRCLVCNQKLIETDSVGLVLVPKVVRRRYTKFWLCEQCGKIYWRGSHTEKMLHTLHAWMEFD